MVNAYCEQKTNNLQIDHYRPVKEYPWLKNEWSNLLPACSECSASKSNIFPTKGINLSLSRLKEYPKLEKKDYRADSKYFLSEEPLLIHPEIDTAENHFYFDKKGFIQSFTERGKETINLLNLNNGSYASKRLKLYKIFFEQLKDKIVKNSHPNFFSDLSRSAEKSSEFSLLGIQLCYQFETFLCQNVVLYIQSNIPELYADKMDTLVKFDYVVGGYLHKNGKNPENEVLKEYYKLFFKVNLGDNHYISNQQISLSTLGFSIENFQGIKALSCETIPLNTQWIFLTGQNGFGKTSILKALLLGLIGKSEFRLEEIDENTRITLKVLYRDINNFPSTYPLARYNIFNSHLFSAQKQDIAAYGAIRTHFIPDASDIAVSDNLFERADTVLNTEQLLKTLDGNEKLKPFKEIIIQAFLKFIPRLSKIEFEANENGTSKRVLYYEKDDNGNELPPVTFDKLAMGMRSIIGLVGDIIQRLSKGKSFRKEEIEAVGFVHSYRFPYFKSLADLYGIVIIDEFDNHLHPSWQRMLVKKLTELFPKVQFIVSTHSAIPLLGAPPDKTVILNVNRTQEEGITVRRLEKIEKELKYLLPNQLLTSDIFDLDEIENIYLNDNELDKIPTEDNYIDIEKNKKLKEDLEKRANNKELFPDDLFSLKK
jgi:energy-coupling factor transporter ATP-binding protein EcfA2